MDGKTRVCGVIGCPVEHSMSPMMHNLFAEQAGLNLAYVPFRVEDQGVGEAVNGAFALNILGLNVTVPHKQRVMEYLTDIDEDARAVGAVNTLVRTEHGYKGYNTDCAGLKRSLEKAGISVKGQECILLGAGGAAKAAACVLAKGGAAAVYILNRNVQRGEELASAINHIAGRCLIKALPLDRYEDIPFKKAGYLAVQSTSVGMHPNVEDVIIDDPAFYQLVHTGVDIVYTPAETRFMKMVRTTGGRAVNGLDMLLYQGVIAFELWNPGTVVVEDSIRMARERIKAHLSGSVKEPNLILIGFMGAGKTHVGERYAREYGVLMTDTDQLIEKAAGMPISQIFQEKGEEEFRKLETAVLEELLRQPGGRVISVGGGLPLREENRLLLKKLGTVAYLDVTPETVMERIGGDVSDRPMLQGGDVMGRIRELLAFRRPVYLEAADVIVDVNGRAPEEIAKEIRHKAVNLP